MILFSPKKRDARYVARCIAEHDLNPVPETGFQHESDYWQEDDLWMRNVEKYDWGAVMFISNYSTNEHATMVLIGDVDIAGGRAYNRGREFTVPVRWYAKLANDLRARPVALRLPGCLGFHQSDHVCDGGMNEHKQIEPPCAWRTQCIALQDHSLKSDQLVENILQGKNPEMITQMLDQMVGDVAEDKGESPEERPIETPADMVAHFAAEAGEETGVRVAVDRTAAGNGDLFVVDRMEKSSYLTLYIMIGKHPKGLVSFHYLKRTGTWKAYLPLDTNSDLLRGIVESDIRKCNDGWRFKSIVRDISFGSTRWVHILRIAQNLIVQEMSL